MTEFVHRFQRLVRDTPGRPIVFDAAGGRTVTFADLAQQAVSYTAWLSACGRGPDDLVLLAIGNRVPALALWIACRSLGIAVMPVDASATPPELAALARRFGGRTVVVAPSDHAPAVLGRSLRAPADLAAFEIPDVSPAPEIYRGAAALKLTSGSTGLPKATFTTEAQLLLDSAHITEAMDIRPDDVQLAAIPLSHAYGIGNLLVPALVNGTAMVLRESFVPHQLPADARRYSARVFPGVPFMFEHFLAVPPEHGWPAGLTRLISAGARLEGATVRAFGETFGVKVHSFYGTTETGGIAFDADDELREQPSVGRPMRDVTIALAPIDGAPEDGGRVHVSGPAVSSGYAGEPLADGDFTGDGYLTGDFGRFDGEGRLTLTGRLSLFINVAGRKVQPEEIEQTLREMPAVADVRVLAAPDAARGQRIVACIVPRNGERNVLAVRAFCASRLAAYKIPRTIVWLDRIPLTERGKTDRSRLESIVRDAAEVGETRML